MNKQEMNEQSWYDPKETIKNIFAKIKNMTELTDEFVKTFCDTLMAPFQKFVLENIFTGPSKDGEPGQQIVINRYTIYNNLRKK